MSAKKTFSLETIANLGMAIDEANDRGDASLLTQLEQECNSLAKKSEGTNRVYLLYFQANALSGIIAANSQAQNPSWDDDLSNRIKNLLLLRKSVSDSAFQSVDSVWQCQIRTNLANTLAGLSRPVAAIEQYNSALSFQPRYAKTLLGLSSSIQQIAISLYDEGHQIHLMAHVLSLIDRALDSKAICEGDREVYAPHAEERRQWIVDNLTRAEYDPEFDLDDFSLGETEEERVYRTWCLRERLFVNPLNEPLTKNVAATDVFHLPSHNYKIGEAARFPDYFNLLKQEYVSARYRLFVAMHKKAPDFLMRDVLLLDGGQDQILGHQADELRSAYRSVYSMFDKISIFLNSYLKLGLKPKRVKFRQVWFEKQPDGSIEIRNEFRESQNWALRGLFFLSKDLYDDNFHQVAEPDAAMLNQFRNQIEHKFLVLHHLPQNSPRGEQWAISVEEFQQKTIRLLRLAREALFYLSIAMNLNEREKEQKNDNSVRVVHKSKPMDPQNSLGDF
ncbi:MAG: LA2681 family HEPN domain-containing protein [Caldilineaceae bacterium]|nr:LA2681 family HEPN domain-containing protein [Caldilineaceae bacterium]MDE0339132.1 LA2681 family HEPN domain-containing protein [Caldilineaceae bacterium]